MSSVKDPGDKKRLSLARDHRTFPLEGNKNFRSAWRQKKARSNRQFRRASKIALAGSTEIETGEPAPSMPAKAMRSLKKWYVTSLAQSILIKNDSRRLRWHFWKDREILGARIAMMRSRGKN
jgi:hypothetical protein